MPDSKDEKKRRRIGARDDYTCADCGRQMAPDDPDLTVDHVIPRAMGGTKADWNLVVMCQPCNQRKGDKPPRTGWHGRLHELFPTDYP